MHKCRTKEYFGYVQCFACLKYGHREVRCTERQPTCVHCGQQGHRVEGCTKKQEPPKCANCKNEHTATYPLCIERAKAVEKEARLTDYRDSQ